MYKATQATQDQYYNTHTIRSFVMDLSLFGRGVFIASKIQLAKIVRRIK
jgi:hypothetical protein